MLGLSKNLFNKTGLAESSPVSIEKVSAVNEQMFEHLGALLSAVKKVNRINQELHLYDKIDLGQDNTQLVPVPLEPPEPPVRTVEEIPPAPVLEKESAEKMLEVASIAVKKGDKMLWGKRRDSKKWTTPGGGIEEGEKPVSAAARELKEEAGIKVKEDRLTKITTKVITSELGKKIKVHGYKVNVPEKTKTTTKNDPDKEVKRWNWESIKDNKLPSEVVNNMHAKKNVLLKPLGIREKTAGGPGSGVAEDNTKPISCLPLTEYVTIMKRKTFMESKKPFIKNKTIKLSKIKFVGQKKYIPKKLEKFIKAIKNNESWPFEKAIDVTVDKNGDYAVLDGHHRFLVAKHFNKPSIKANIYTVGEKDRSEEFLEKQAGLYNLIAKAGKTMLGPAISKAPSVIGDVIKKGRAGFTKGNIIESAKNMGKGTYNLAFGGKTINGKWDPLYGVKSMGKARERYMSGPLKGMYKYTDDGEHLLDLNKKRNWGGFIKDEFSGASATRGDLAAKQLANQKKSLINPEHNMEVGEYLRTASKAEKQHLADINNMKVTEFIKKHPKLAANYYGRNVVQKGMTVGFPLMALNDIRTGEAGKSDPNSSHLGNNLGTLAEAGGWALTGPLGIAGALGAVTGLKGGAKMIGNAISNPKKVPQAQFSVPESPNMQMYDRISGYAPQMIRQPIQRARETFIPQRFQG